MLNQESGIENTRLTQFNRFNWLGFASCFHDLFLEVRKSWNNTSVLPVFGKLFLVLLRSISRRNRLYSIFYFEQSEKRAKRHIPLLTNRGTV